VIRSLLRLLQGPFLKLYAIYFKNKHLSILNAFEGMLNEGDWSVRGSVIISVSSEVPSAFVAVK